MIKHEFYSSVYKLNDFTCIASHHMQCWGRGAGTLLHPPTTSAHASVANSMPMSGLDLLRLVDNDDKTKNFKPVTSISSMLQNAGQSQPSCIVANEFAARGSQKINCEKCPSAFDTQSQLITHILTTPDHLGGDGGLGAMQNNSFANAAGVYNVKPEFNS